MLLTPFIPLENTVAILVELQREFVETVQLELQFVFEMVVVIVASVTVDVGTHALLGTTVHPFGEHLVFI